MMKLHLRVWAGKETLATKQGKKIAAFPAFEQWLSKQPDGQLEVFAGRWFVVSREAIPFLVKGGRVFCAHPSYISKKGLKAEDFPGFYAFEAWEKASKTTSMWAGIQSFSDDVVDKVKTAGRPVTLDGAQVKKVMLDQPTIEAATKIGKGNLSAGLREAVSKYQA